MSETREPSRSGAPHQIGFSRDVPNLASTKNTASHLQWQTTPQGGRIAAISIMSPDARGMRLGILVHALPPSALLRFFSQDSNTAYEVTAQQVLDIIGRNVGAGDTSEEAKTFWAPEVTGSEVTIEIELPSGISAEQVEIAVPRISHLWASSLAGTGIGTSSPCENDATCSAPWIEEENATAQIQFVNSGATYLCTGTLLNNTTSDLTPYFLTANHCISDQTTASTLVTHWFYRSTYCNSGVLNPSNRALFSGAQMLYQNVTTDTSFLLLNEMPPAGAAYAGWSPNAVTLGASVTDVHHPKADLLKISSGLVNRFDACTTSASSVFWCGSDPLHGDYLRVVFSSGTVEGGSSGSGLFISDSSGSHLLVGQLLGGTSSCTGATGIFGRFDLAFNTALNQWLQPAAKFPIDVRTYVPAANAPQGYMSFLRVINTGATASPIYVSVIDETSGSVGPSSRLTTSLAPKGAMTFSAPQVEAALGTALPAGSRPRIRVSCNASTSIEVQSFLLQPGGVFNEISGAQTSAPLTPALSGVAITTFVPAASAPAGYQSFIRVINTSATSSPLTVTRIDPVTGVAGSAGILHPALGGGSAMTFPAGSVEAALGQSLSANDRPSILFSVVPPSTIEVQSFLSQPGGAYTDISTSQGGNAYELLPGGGASIDVRSYVPAAMVGYTSFIRINNVGSAATPVTGSLIDATTGNVLGTATIVWSLAQSGAITLSSAQIEAALGLAISADQRPRLRVSSATADLRVQSFLLQPGGAYNEISPALRGTSVQVRIYAPAADVKSGYTTYLRVINVGNAATPVSVALIDGTTGNTGPTGILLASLPVGAARTLSSAAVEAALGTPVASGTRPRLLISGTSTLEVQSFLIQPGGAITEVSGAQ